MGQWKVLSRVVLAIVAAPVLLIMVACGPSAPDAESVVADGTLPAPATESPGSISGAPASVSPTPAPSREQASEATATPLVSQTAALGTQAAEPIALAPTETEPVTFTPAATSALSEPGVGKESATATLDNTEPAYAPSGSQPPIFVEMIQAPLSPEPSSRVPPADFGPTGAFAYDPSNKLLLVPPSVQILPTTEVLVGLTSATMPNRPYVPSELLQIPSSQTAPLSVMAVDAASGALTLEYAGQTFELQPGESRSFKQKGSGDLAVVVVTTITNHGRLAVIDLMLDDPGSR